MVCSSVNRTDPVQWRKHYYSDEETAVDVQLQVYRSLVPRPLPRFQCCTCNIENVGCATLKTWEWPGDEARFIVVSSRVLSIAALSEAITK